MTWQDDGLGRAGPHRVKAKMLTSAKHLWELLQDCWKNIPGDYLLKLIKRMPRVCKAVIKAKGSFIRSCPEEEGHFKCISFSPHWGTQTLFFRLSSPHGSEEFQGDTSTCRYRCRCFSAGSALLLSRAQLLLAVLLRSRTRQYPPMSDPTPAFATTAIHYACAHCKKKWASGQPSPFCLSCVPPTMSVPQEAPRSRDECTPPPPEWAVAMSQSVSDLTKFYQSLVQAPKRIPLLSNATSATNASHGDSLAPVQDPHRGRPDKRDRKRTLSRSSSSSLDGIPLSARSLSSQADVGSDLSSQSESDSDADQTSGTQEMDVSVAFKRIKRPSRVFPNHKEFNNTTSTHWENPGKRFLGKKRLDVLYPFPFDLVSKWSESPKVDPPVSRLSSQTVLSIPDAASLKDGNQGKHRVTKRGPVLSYPMFTLVTSEDIAESDPTDRQIEALAKSAFEASGASLCPSFASSWVAKAVSAWAKTLRRSILASAPAEELSDFADQISLAGKYLMNASLDAAACSTRANSNIVAIRRILWLKAWNADPASKKSLTGLPFQGSRLFGTQLDQMISDATGGKSTFLPQSKPKRPFNRRGPSAFALFGPSPQETPTRTVLPRRETEENLLSDLHHTGGLRATPQNHRDLGATGFLTNDGSPPPGNPSRVGGRLLLFSEVWLSVVDDAWVREIVTSGSSS
ncbi:unnamed protein product [Ranitomeya imitator]|uniref:Lamina-associated polypeptide 2 alpha C-terminal domain-containing protein n=1 Tax=Ranitomeya imitator TaxID=111125 RepID=A0ABN9M8Q6_9NEOB|nr:unnamed protein product [Ranitomeya imitator]